MAFSKDSAVVLDDAKSITPSESASQQGPPVSTAPSRKGGRRKLPPKPSQDKDTPPGAVQVPKGGQAKTGKSSPVTSSTIPLSGWGEIDLTSHRRDVEPTFTVDARPYADLVDTSYQCVQSRFSAGGKHIPRSLFRYYCFTMWWFRALWLVKNNGGVLSSDQKNFLNVMLAGEEFQVPSHIAQYLGNMGNFSQGGEQFFFRLLDHSLGTVEGATVQKGWFQTGTAGNRVDNASFWIYSQLPSPAVACSDICNEAESSLPAPGDLVGLDLIAPKDGVDRVVHPTENIIGWSNVPLAPAHSSWRSSFASLGWSGNGIAPDCQTHFNVSTSTLRWISDRLGTLKDFKVHSTKQLVLSTQGHQMQAYYLGVDVPATQLSQYPPVDGYATNHLCASRFSELAVYSRYMVDSKVLAPAFSFGFRLERSLLFRDYHNREPRYHNESNFSPWIVMNAANNARLQLTPAQLSNMNATFSFGSAPYINVRRFATHGLNRSVGLDAAVILSDTR